MTQTNPPERTHEQTGQPEPARRWRWEISNADDVSYLPPDGKAIWHPDEVVAALNETESLRARLEAAEAYIEALESEEIGDTFKAASAAYERVRGRGATDGAPLWKCPVCGSADCGRQCGSCGERPCAHAADCPEWAGAEGGERRGF